ncbi:hypothetical protein CA13_18130 [Planctomycetes bacterium CA13]|uniref:DUF1772 domain-containing protein n=1 Tax=Novipirellula herctigrandis TaxID=2527986 RepID=A0A5C5Z0M1_9BACT|nr:hypothetical protein CA13_18130 [Planctomycetes bacterium CA13]
MLLFVKNMMIASAILPIALLAAAFLCTLVAGFVLLFAVVVMPGIGTLPDRDFLRSFQAIDKVIQGNQPLFLLTWAGSIVSLVIATALSVWQLDGAIRVIVVVAFGTYLIGVQLPTFTINIPLNNRVQTLELDRLDEATLADERYHFEARWNRWNVTRTVFACIVSVLLLIVLVVFHAQ